MDLRFVAVLVAVPCSTLACGSSSDSAEGGPPADAGAPADASTDADADADRGSGGSDPGCDAFAADLQLRVDAERAKQGVAHMALGVATTRCDKTIVFSDDEGTSTTPDALWQVGSLTKMYIAATVLRLAEERKLTIEDSLVDYLPDFPDAENITLRALLNHTSGVFDYLQTAEAVAAINADPGAAISDDELIAFATEHGPAFAPGTSWGYSNTDYIILGRVIEEATGAPLGEVLRTRALERAELSHSFLASVEEPIGEHVPGFQAGNDLTDVVNPKWWGAAGAMQATPSDALDWTRRLYGTTDVIGEASMAQMLDFVPTDHSQYRYGLGTVEWEASATHGNGPAYGHFGSLPGYQCEALYHPRKQMAITALVSDSDGKPHALVVSGYEALATLESTPANNR